VLVGLIGWPVSHSRSPRIHEAAFAALELPGRYVLLPVEPERVGEAVRGLRALGFRGANVTVPHKQAVIPHLDHVTDTARTLDAVNTIWVDANGRLCGDNTDMAGFLTDLRDEEVNLAGRRALVLGAGGSARAVVHGLAQAGCARVTVLNRTRERAESLLARVQAAGCELLAASFPDDVAEHAQAAELVVNCTSLGMTPHDDALAWDPTVSFRPDQVVYDLVYTPRRTALLAKAAADGARALGGLGMLVRQGALAFERWTGQRAPVSVMMQAAEES
jgi:shikimate dehydrogenase